jgi:hypothetical protein
MQAYAFIRVKRFAGAETRVVLAHFLPRDGCAQVENALVFPENVHSVRRADKNREIRPTMHYEGEAAARGRRNQFKSAQVIEPEEATSSRTSS